MHGLTSTLTDILHGVQEVILPQQQHAAAIATAMTASQPRALPRPAAEQLVAASYGSLHWRLVRKGPSTPLSLLLPPLVLCARAARPSSACRSTRLTSRWPMFGAWGASWSWWGRATRRRRHMHRWGGWGGVCRLGTAGTLHGLPCVGVRYASRCYHKSACATWVRY